MSLSLAADGTFRQLVIGWRAGCREVGANYHTRTRFREPIRRQTRTEIGEHGYYDVGNRRASARIRVRMTGHQLSAYRWKGTFRARVVYREHGHVVDRCATPALRWHASAPQIHIHMEGDTDDYILGGQTVDVQTPADTVPFNASKREIHSGAGPYTIDIAAPRHKTLRSGLSFATTRYPFNEGGGGLDVSGDGRGCNTSKGTVSVDRARFDRTGAVISMQLRFEQHCEGGPSALHGVIVYHR